ncbi:MAG TPA: YIP1 family protein [Gemmatirosa sp.]
MTEGAADDRAASAVVPPRAALWEDFVDVFASPSAVFARRSDGAYAGGLTLLGVLSAVVFVAARGFWQPYFARQMELGIAAQQASGKLTAAQVESARPTMERFADLFTWAVGTLGTPLIVMFVALLVLGAARAVGARLTYGQSLVVATLAYVPRLLALLAGAGVLARSDVTGFAEGAIPTSPAALLQPGASRVLVALLVRFDPFVLWSTLLIGIGVAVIGRVPRGKGATAALLVWAFATLGALLGALRAAAAAS